ncbi:TPA: site-specific integrase [Vibrio parahaemolyticus]|nr:site-specific integrase [Vibrio parahaemolyticus]HCH2585468.1 site-specific integrase [Vibrio parahaemolyticus]HCM1319412.1 site-specific integrase [Vibrio parahaemolyticus]
MAAKLNDKQLRSLVKNGKVGKHSLGHGLYLRISAEGTPFWVVRYSIHGKRREISIGKYGLQYGEMKLAQALEKTFELKAGISKGIDPLAEKKRPTSLQMKTVNDVAEDWLAKDIEPRLKHPKIPRRIYEKELSPFIGELTLAQVTPLDIRAILERIAQSGRPSIANDTLMYCKQMFRHAISLNLMQSNPAESLTVRHAGGIEKSRDRYLSDEEIKKLFPILRKYSSTFTRENYLAISLLLMLGVRKNELLCEKWSAISFEQSTWFLVRDHNKKGGSIDIPLPKQALVILQELKVRACSSDYIFPNRRVSKRAAHVSADTLNHAIAKMFGKVSRTGYQDLLSKEGIDYFTVHDLRRTCRTLLAKLEIQGHIAERCLNHKLKGVESIYNKHDYFEERREALQKLADYLEPTIAISPT